MTRKEQLRRRALAFAEARYHAQDDGPPLGTVQELMLAYERGYQDARKDARRLLHGGGSIGGRRTKPSKNSCNG